MASDDYHRRCRLVGILEVESLCPHLPVGVSCHQMALQDRNCVLALPLPGGLQGGSHCRIVVRRIRLNVSVPTSSLIMHAQDLLLQLRLAAD